MQCRCSVRLFLFFPMWLAAVSATTLCDTHPNAATYGRALYVQHQRVHLLPAETSYFSFQNALSVDPVFYLAMPESVARKMENSDPKKTL